MPSKKAAQDSLTRSLSGLKANPNLAEQIMSGPVKHCLPKRKITDATLISIVLVGMAATTMAAGLIVAGEPLGLLRWIGDARTSIPEDTQHVTEQIIFTTAEFLQEEMPEAGQENPGQKNTLITQPVEMSNATITVQEAATDGYGIYLSIRADPGDEGTLLLNHSINPFEDAPEAIGQSSGHTGQTIAEWAVAHGFQELIRVSLHSPPTETFANGRLLSSETFDPETNERHIAQIDVFESDRVSSGSNFDSFHNAKMSLNEDGSVTIMTAGGFVPQESYTISCMLIPWRMTSDGKPDPYIRDIPSSDENDSLLDFSSAERELLSFSFPSSSDMSVSELAKYEGTTAMLDSDESLATVGVQFVRTLLNDYCVVTCNDPSRVYEAISVYLDSNGTNRIGNSELFISCYRLTDGEIRFIQSVIMPEEFPPQLYIRWDDYEYNLTQNAVVYKDDNTEK